MNLILLPHYFKRIGWLMILLLIPFAFLLKGIGMNREDGGNVLSIVVMLGLFFTILSKEKEETDEINIIRNEELAKTFIQVMVFCIINIITKLVFKTTTSGMFDSFVGILFFCSLYFQLAFWWRTSGKIKNQNYTKSPNNYKQQRP